MGLRVGLVFPGDPRLRSTWSGTPAGLAGGLEEEGVEVVGISVQPPAPIDATLKNLIAAARFRRCWRGDAYASLRLARAVARVSPALGRAQTRVARAKLRSSGSLDAVVQIGTGYALPPLDAPVVTLEDLTVIQAVELGYPEYVALPERARRRRVERQREAYRLASACCATTAWASRSIVDDYGIADPKVHAVGVGRNHSAPSGPRDWSRPRYLFVGTSWYGKNGDAVVRAFARVRELIPDARLDVVGSHPRLDLDGVTTHGTLHMSVESDRAKMSSLFTNATCFVLPSRYEASAIAYVEAGGAGLPCIGTSVGGARELIGDAGRIVDPRDDEALFAAMVELADPATASTLGAVALRRAHLFTWNAVARRVLAALGLADAAHLQLDASAPAQPASPSGATASPPRASS